MSSEAKRASLLPPDGTFIFVKAVLTVIVPASPPPFRVLIVTWLFTTGVKEYSIALVQTSMMVITVYTDQIGNHLMNLYHF